MFISNKEGNLSKYLQYRLGDCPGPLVNACIEILRGPLGTERSLCIAPGGNHMTDLQGVFRLMLYYVHVDRRECRKRSTGGEQNTAIPAELTFHS